MICGWQIIHVSLVINHYTYDRVCFIFLVCFRFAFSGPHQQQRIPQQHQEQLQQPKMIFIFQGEMRNVRFSGLVKEF